MSHSSPWSALLISRSARRPLHSNPGWWLTSPGEAGAGCAPARFPLVTSPSTAGATAFRYRDATRAGELVGRSRAVERPRLVYGQRGEPDQQRPPALRRLRNPRRWCRLPGDPRELASQGRSDPCCVGLGHVCVRSGPLLVDRVGEHAVPAIEVFGGERQLIADVPVGIQDCPSVRLVTQQNATPVA